MKNVCYCFRCRTQPRTGRFGAKFSGFCGFARKLIFLGKPRLKVKRFVRGVLIDSSAASRRNPPKSFMDRGGVVSH